MATSKIQNNNSLTIHKQYQYNYESWQISTWTHHACFASGCTTLLITLAKCIHLTPNGLGKWLQLILAAFIGYLFSDFATGVYHWAIDNYGTPQTPFFGDQIEAFQGHHQQPWAITKRHLANNLSVPSAAVTIVVMPINVVLGDPVMLGFVGVFAGCVMFSQLFHAWAHTPKGKLPLMVVALQDVRVLVERAEHAAHHRPPYNKCYCIVSGVWNGLLDWSRFFFVLEFFIFNVFGTSHVHGVTKILWTRGLHTRRIQLIWSWMYDP